jgi:hypothetical protein
VRVQAYIMLAAGLLFAPVRGQCQWKELPATGSPTERLPDRTIYAGQSGLGPLLSATLLDKDRNAKERKAIVQVQTDGVRLVDPSTVHNQPKLDEAHIQYRIDNEPVRNSISKTWTFENLAAGDHEIHIALATSDNHPIGKPKRLHVHIP